MISLVSGVLVTVVWYYPFYIYATALPIALLVYIYFEEPSQTADPVVADGGQETYRTRLVSLVRKRRVSAIVVSRTLPNVVRISFVTYISLIVVRLLSGTPAQAGVLYAVWSVISALGASQGGRITQLIRTRYPALLVSHVCLGVGMLIVVFSPEFYIAGIGTVIGAFGSGLTITMYRSLLTEFSPADLRAGIVSIGATGGRFTGTITPVLFGGVLGIMTPSVGFTTAVHLAGVGAAVIGGGGGILCVLIAMKSPPVTT
jgi:MFS family permease